MIEYDVRINELYDRFYERLSKSFNRIKSINISIDKKIDTPFGYEMEQTIISYKIIYYDSMSSIKWGFIGSEAAYQKYDSPITDRIEILVADRVRMNRIVNKSYKEFDNYIDKEIAKMSLSGYDSYFLPDDANVSVVNLKLSVDESCISPSGNSVSHILLRPVIALAVEEK